MKLILLVDENNGMLFNNRRQSKDRILIKEILERAQNHPIWITDFSKDLFEDTQRYRILGDIKAIEKIAKEEYCLIENWDPVLFIDKAEELILYNWNRKYPADRFFCVSMEEWKLISEREIKGSSHEKITERTYRKERKVW